MACSSCGVEGPWRTCPVCAGDEVRAVEAGLIPDPRGQDPVTVQLEAVARMAEREGYVDAAAWIRRRLAGQGPIASLALRAAAGVRQV